MNAIITLVTLILGPWTVTFDEAASQLTLTDRDARTEIVGTLHFRSGDKDWTIAAPRDGVEHRLALVDPGGNVQGYITFQENGSRLEMMVEHRTRQFYEGVLSFDGKVDFNPVSFACRTTPFAGQEVLPLASGPADSALNDTIFARDEDLALRILGNGVSITTLGEGKYGLAFFGRIQKVDEASWTFDAEADYLKDRWVPYFSPIDRVRCPKPPTGWMSWNTYFDKATAEDNLAEARLGKKYFQPLGMEFWSIESWQGNSNELPVAKFYNMNLEANPEQFPLGMKKLAEDIRALGFRPGIWMAPYGTGNEEFYNAHKDWFLHDADGKPIASWNGRFTMDPTHPDALENLRRIHDVAAHDWGYEFFKVDGMSGSGSHYMAHLYERPEIRARFRDPSVTNPFEQTVKVLREGIGSDRILLACQGHLTGPEAAYADAARIGADIVHPNEPVKWENLKNQAGRTINQIFVHNIVFFADPDTLLLGDLELEQARVAATIVSLPGQMMFAGDKLAQLSPEKIGMIQRTLPVADVRPMNLFPNFDLLPIWDLRVRRDFIDYDVVALFNWSDEAKTVGFDFAELGLPADAESLLYEFWTNRYFGAASGRFETEIPGRAVRLLAVHRRLDRPQFLSSDRHLTQGAVDLTALSWNAEKRELSGRVQLAAEFPTVLRFAVPEGFALKKAAAEGVDCSSAAEADGRVLAVTLKAAEAKETGFTLEF